MEKNVIIAGFGGQGILLTGTILANSYMLDDKNVICCPCYGAEMRGGEVNCEVVVSDEDEVCANKSEADYVIALNDLSYNKFTKKLKKGGTVIANSSLVPKIKIRDDINYIFADLSDIAKDLGDIRTTNMVSLGLFAKVENLKLETLKNAVKKVFATKPQAVLDLNFKALEQGLNCKIEK